jgi:hypothetical protein
MFRIYAEEQLFHLGYFYLWLCMMVHVLSQNLIRIHLEPSCSHDLTVFESKKKKTDEAEESKYL